MDIQNLKIRELGKDEPIPFSLLLLADESIEAINKYIFDSDIFVLENKGQLIGVYVLQAISEKVWEVKNIAVETEFQGLGIGTFLLKDATERARKKGADVLDIGTGSTGVRQLYLYQREGFEVHSIKKNFFTDNYSQPIYENGIHLKHMIMLRKILNENV